MLVLFRCNARKYAYDTVSGYLRTLSGLEFRMLEAIQPPLTPLCPTALRYELAKFDSADVEEAYDELYAAFRKDLIFVPESGTLTPPTADTETVTAAVLAATKRLTAPVAVGNDPEGIATTILKQKNLYK
ncbi:MAG: hypothetical protein IJY50_03975 [Clostridia bacterium]|nr:hypothetical protein [Clostridia bacterium]